MPTNIIFRMIKRYSLPITYSKYKIIPIHYSSTTEILLKLILHYKTNSKMARCCGSFQKTLAIEENTV